mgnify:CR=1 FL=1
MAVDEFQSTLPLRGATRRGCSTVAVAVISIHAPLTGSDSCASPLPKAGEYFNPRSPYGERPQRRPGPWTCLIFQSTLPLRGATNSATSLCKNIVISIHAPLTGSDSDGDLSTLTTKYFNPRSPYGERPAKGIIHIPTKKFQSTLPLRGATHGNHP